MKIVKFKCGKYAIRRYYWFFKEYKDLISNGYWWLASSPHIKDCIGTKEEYLAVIEKIKDRNKYTEVPFND